MNPPRPEITAATLLAQPKATRREQQKARDRQHYGGAA